MKYSHAGYLILNYTEWRFLSVCIISLWATVCFRPLGFTLNFNMSNICNRNQNWKRSQFFSLVLSSPFHLKFRNGFLSHSNFLNCFCGFIWFLPRLVRGESNLGKLKPLPFHATKAKSCNPYNFSDGKESLENIKLSIIFTRRRLCLATLRFHSGKPWQWRESRNIRSRFSPSLQTDQLVLHVMKFHKLQLGLCIICQLWWYRSCPNPSEDDGELYVPQKGLLSNNSTHFSPGPSQGGTETNKRGWKNLATRLEEFGNSAVTSAAASVEIQLDLNNNKELEPCKAIQDILIPSPHVQPQIQMP